MQEPFRSRMKQKSNWPFEERPDRGTGHIVCWGPTETAQQQRWPALTFTRSSLQPKEPPVTGRRKPNPVLLTQTSGILVLDEGQSQWTFTLILRWYTQKILSWSGCMEFFILILCATHSQHSEPGQGGEMHQGRTLNPQHVQEHLSVLWSGSIHYLSTLLGLLIWS